MFSTHSMKFVGIQFEKVFILSIFDRSSFVRPVFGQVPVLILFDFKCSLLQEFDFLLQLWIYLTVHSGLSTQQIF